MTEEKKQWYIDYANLAVKYRDINTEILSLFEKGGISEEEVLIKVKEMLAVGDELEMLQKEHADRRKEPVYS